MFIMGIDAGNYETKVCTINGINNFPSDIGEYRERKLIETFGDHDIIWEYEGRKGFGGTLAKYESEFGGTVKGKTKAHSEAILRVLIAIHKYGKEENKIVLGQPIETHEEGEKDKIKQALKKEHILKINGIEKKFIITGIEVAPEGAASIISNPVKGKVRIIDIGSGTINFATLQDLKRIDKESFTKQIGMDTIRNKDPKEMSQGIYKITSSNWDRKDETYLTGGAAETIFPHLNEYLHNLKVLKPRLNNSIFHTRYANAVAFYLIAKGVFESENN